MIITVLYYINFQIFGVDKVMEAWLRCFGHVQRRDSGCDGQRMLMMLPGRRKRGRSQKNGYSVGGHEDAWCNVDME